MDTILRFYDELAADYDLIFVDWEAAVRRQGALVSSLLAAEHRQVLDIACGIGTQAIGLALAGHTVVARDLSPAMVARAGREAARLGVDLDVGVGDMREARPGDAGCFDAVIAFDNALPHLDSDGELLAALAAARAALRPGGVLLASVRDYDRLLDEPLLDERPRFDPPRLLGAGDRQRIVLQLWTWTDERRYRFDHIILCPDAELGWRARVRVGHYRAVRLAELSTLATETGFSEVEWLPTERTGFHQPVLRARAADRP